MPAPFIVASHKVHVDPDIAFLGEVWTAPLGNPQTPWYAELTVTLPPGYSGSFDIQMILDGDNDGPSFEFLRLEGPAQPFALSLESPGGGNNANSPQLADPGTYVLRWEFDGTNMNGYLNGILFNTIPAGDLSAVSTPAFRFLTDEADENVTFGPMKWAFTQ